MLMRVDAPRLDELDRLDDATASIILQLHNRDIEELLDASKGKGRDGEPSDADLAIATYQKELRERKTILADLYMARSLTQAVISDAALLGKSLAEEKTAMEDRALAHRLAGINAPSAASEQRTAGYTLDDGFLARLAALYVSGRNDESDTSENITKTNSPGAAESSAWAASRQNPSIAVHRQCTACDQKKPLFDIFQTLWTPLLQRVLTNPFRAVNYRRDLISTSMLPSGDSLGVCQKIFESSIAPHIRIEEH